MSGFDKYVLQEKLVAKGWIVVSSGRLKPSKDVIQRLMAADYHVYDARDIHEAVFDESLYETEAT